MPFNSGRSATVKSAAVTWYEASPHLPHLVLAPARTRQLNRSAVLHVRGALSDMRRSSRKSMRAPKDGVHSPIMPPSPRAPSSDHLMLVQGHVFDDGILWQVPTGKRYCINVRLRASLHSCLLCFLLVSGLQVLLQLAPLNLLKTHRECRSPSSRSEAGGSHASEHASLAALVAGRH